MTVHAPTFDVTGHGLSVMEPLPHRLLAEAADHPELNNKHALMRDILSQDPVYGRFSLIKKSFSQSSDVR